jgi:hypothetical protein
MVEKAAQETRETGSSPEGKGEEQLERMMRTNDRTTTALLYLEPPPPTRVAEAPLEAAFA